VGEDPRNCNFQAAARSAALRQDVDVIVTGHTHLGGRFPFDGRLHLNSGSCHWGRRQILEIDTRAGVYAHRDAA
jgi:predicted phosphodiesterase